VTGQQSNGNDVAEVVECWGTVMPAGVNLGRRLFETGQLQEMMRENLTAQEMLDELAQAAA